MDRFPTVLVQSGPSSVVVLPLRPTRAFPIARSVASDSCQRSRELGVVSAAVPGR